jgi:hypothetical protein
MVGMMAVEVEDVQALVIVRFGGVHHDKIRELLFAPYIWLFAPNSRDSSKPDHK